MSSNNNSPSTESKLSQPTIADVYELLTKCASKNDLTNITKQIQSFTTETTNRLQVVDEKIEEIATTSSRNTDRIDSLEATVESLKQDQLKNNLCISGVPPEILNNIDSADAVIAIAKALNVELNVHHFTSYTIANNKFIIVQLYNIKHKQGMRNRIKIKKSLMVEECFNGASNSQVYLNDHLTPYFNSLFVMARKAKIEGKIASVSSYGGKIRVRKLASDSPTIVTTEKQLIALINHECDLTSDTDSSVHIVGSDNEASQTTHVAKTDYKNNTGSQSTVIVRSNNSNTIRNLRNVDKRGKENKTHKRRLEAVSARSEQQEQQRRKHPRAAKHTT